MNQPKIGIVGWNVGENSFGATKPYMEFLSRYGDVYILPPSATILEDLDLLVLPGGKDTMSINYNQVPSFFNTDPDIMKEFFLLNNLGKYVANGTPIFGICLGLQMLNVHLGGDLRQHVAHPYNENEKRYELIHKCDFTPAYSNLKKTLQLTKEFKVNSLHHQGVHITNLAPKLKAILQFEDVIEAFIHEKLPIAAVQYHPEEIYDEVSDYLIKTLIKHGKKAGKPEGSPKEELATIQN